MLRTLAAAVTIGMVGGAVIAVAENAADVSTARLTLPAACQDALVRVYFTPGGDRLDGEARRALDRASRDVAACDAVEIEVAAPRPVVADARARRLAARRSAAITVALNGRGVAGEIYVVPVTEAVATTEKNSGPDYIEVGLRPAPAAQRIVRGDVTGVS